MMLCTGDFCDKKDTCANYFRNADMSEPCEVESFATFGSGKVSTDANGSYIEEDEVWCGPNGHYKRYEKKEESNTVENTQTLSCKIKLKNFKTMMNAVKNITESEKNKYGREILKFIQLTVTEGHVVAIACNGYQLSKYKLLQPNEEEFTCYFKPFYFRSFQWMEDLDVVVTLNKKTNLVSIKMPATFGSINYEFIQPTEEYPTTVLKALEDAKKDTNNSVAIRPGLLNVSSKCFNLADRYGWVEVFTPKNELSPVYCKSNISEDEELEHILLPVRRS